MPNTFDPFGPTQEGIYKRMSEVLERSVENKARVLPSFGSGMVLNGESWQLRCFLTLIPHMKALVIENKPIVKSESAYRFYLVRDLVQEGIVDCGEIEDNQLFGKTWDLFLFCKIQALRPLRDASILRPFQNQTIVTPPDRVFPKLRSILPTFSIVSRDKSGIRKFLDMCDTVLTDELEQEDLIKYLRMTTISPKQFLRA